MNNKKQGKQRGLLEAIRQRIYLISCRQNDVIWEYRRYTAGGGGGGGGGVNLVEHILYFTGLCCNHDLEAVALSPRCYLLL